MLNACPRCGSILERARRSLAGRLFFRKVLSCPECGYVARTWRIPFERTATFVFTRYSRCIQCGNYKVRRLSGRDRIDSISTHPLSVLLSVTMAPFYHCNPCRLQYHDWRPVHPTAAPEARAVAASASQGPDFV
jgi:uncharacterized protein with PIN domain